MTDATTEPQRLLDDLDLSILAYHVYNQTLLWPLDPWYEQWSRIGSDRRDNMLAHVHDAAAGREDLRGPGSCRTGWPTDERLDPVLTDPSAIHPWHVAVTWDGLRYRCLTADADRVRRLRDVVRCEYTAFPTAGRGPTVVHDPIANPHADADAGDRLYAFEGCTGAIEGRPGAWSVLGIVVDRVDDDGTHDVEIAFRGSQSGSAYRGAFEGMLEESGNADWVTDMEAFKHSADASVSPVGTVLTGFRDATCSAFGTLGAALADIDRRHDRPPRSIRVVGHSLGGALAAVFAAAVGLGQAADDFGPGVSRWPWASLSLTTFGAPKVGDDDFAAHFDDRLDATRVWFTDDPITRFPGNAHVGRPVQLLGSVTGTAAHEPFVIRDGLLAVIRDASGSAPSTDPIDQPWRYASTLAEALAHAEHHGTRPVDLFGDHVVAATDLFVDVAAAVVADRSSYRVPWTKTPYERRRRARQLRDRFTGHVRSLDELAARVGALAGVQPDSDVEDHLRRVLIMREAAVHDWSSADLRPESAVRAALEGTPSPAYVANGAPRTEDVAKVDALIRLRRLHHRIVHEGTADRFRRRHVPVSPMPDVVPASEQHESLRWLPTELRVPRVIPPEARLRSGYKAAYYGSGKVGWDLYDRSPIHHDIAWDPSFRWNQAFPPTGDGWQDPTADDTFVRLRLQGPNPFLLARTSSIEGAPTYALDFTEVFAGVLPAIVARFVDGPTGLAVHDITVGRHRHQPGDPTWTRAKQVVNAADARYAAFVSHLLHVHLLVGQAFALSTYRLPTWHRLRPFLQFFTYATVEVNDLAYKGLLAPSSYFLSSGFLGAGDVFHLFHNGAASFDLDRWNVPRDLERRGLGDLAGRHPYVDDARHVWPVIATAVDEHLDDLGLTDAAVAADLDLGDWYRTLGGLLPGVDADGPLNRERLSDLLAALLWNNVVHEVCGDLSPILGSQDPGDKSIIGLEKLRRAIGDGSLAAPLPPPTMAEVFLLDQASWVSRFNVGGNALLRLDAARFADDPKLIRTVGRLQENLRGVDEHLDATNRDRPVRFARMLPRHWEASISF